MFLLVQALSLTKTTEKIISEEDGGNLRRCVAKLEEENSQLKVSTVDSSAEAVTVLRRALDEGIEDYELLTNGNESLLAECDTLWDQVVDLESELAKVKTSCVG
jgi:predicted RNase H-like nuclease (RuvC/YqgF family)